MQTSNFLKENEQKTNEKKTLNDTFVNRDFAGFVNNEQKKLQQQKLKKILSENEFLFDVFQIHQNLEIENKKLIENLEYIKTRNRQLAETINDLREANNKFNNSELAKDLEATKTENKKLWEIAHKNKETFNNLLEQFEELKKENEELKKNRGVVSKINDNLEIKRLKEQNKELYRKLSALGRVPLSSITIKSIEELYKQGFSYNTIAKMLKVSKTSVYKYVNLYIEKKC